MSNNSTSTDQSLASQSDYGYVPTQWICITFLGLFGASTAIHLAEAIYFRIWWLIPSAVACGILELTGWAARTWSSIQPLILTPYIMQMTTTIIAPTPLIATNFLILEELILLLGPQYSRLSPRIYKWVFLSCDIVSLTVQAVGGGEASAAADGSGNPDDGGHIMLIGIVFQMFTVVVYTILAIEFFLRVFSDRPARDILVDARQSRKTAEAKRNPRVKLMIMCLGIMGVFIFIRSIYRTVELVDGFEGSIITTEIWFNIFDGAMIVLAMATLNVLHPGFLLRHTPYTLASDTSSVEIQSLKDRQPETKLISDSSSVFPSAV
ncbi:RTA1-domain-containing protein [Dentipellis sp. KUC8613]|nr:RTA1-domain-containing protein [Dentipellis sp. KUC8613]